MKTALWIVAIILVVLACLNFAYSGYKKQLAGPGVSTQF